MGQDFMRRVIFRPYRKGMGPTFTLTMWDAGDRWDGTQRRNYVRYRLTMTESKYTPKMRFRRVSTVLFAGDDYSPSPMHSIDGDDAVEGLMGFLTLRPGDTDPDYFAGYTPEQMAFCEQHAEALSCDAMFRFGKECA